MKERIKAADWAAVREDIHTKGFALLPYFLSTDNCHMLISLYNQVGIYRKTVTMERYRFGLGEYKYFSYPLPELIQQLRTAVYQELVPLANQWMEMLQINQHFPESLDALQKLCYENGQTKSTALILKYGKGGHNTLHQDLYGDIFFPIQMVLFLNEPDQEYQGGEFVLTQQIPRAQSKAIVLRPKKGDMLLFTTNFRPMKGKRGHYRVQMKHGVSEVQAGERYTLGIIFHDAMS